MALGMKIHILTDNRAAGHGILAEHGLSVFIEDNGVNVLFDTGQTDVYLHNAPKMGIDLKSTDAIVLSHGHYDHCGGLEHFPISETMSQIYVHAGELKKNRAQNTLKRSCNELGIPWWMEDYQHIENRIVLNPKDIQIALGVSLHAKIPSVSFEATPREFFADSTNSEDDLQIDVMQNEQMLVFEKGNGLTIFLGCSHPGIINCLTHAKALYPNQKIHTVIAGMHLISADDIYIQKTISHLKDMDIGCLIPMHCTGLSAICAMSNAFGDKCIPLCAGQSLTI